MTDPLFDVGDANTPIDDDEADGLRLTWVRTRGDLNDAERGADLFLGLRAREESVRDALGVLARLHRRTLRER